MKKIIVAIDGVSSSGKSSMAKQLAKTLGYKYIDTGAMYRAVTLYAISNRLFGRIDDLEREMDKIKIDFVPNPETGLNETFLNGRNVENEIRGMEVSNRVSEISALSFVRTHLVNIQRNIGKEKGIVMDGRDIGTVVFPDAELKIFVTATAEIRAERRYRELVSKGEKVDYDGILENVRNRDYQDTNRKISPLRKANDAIELDNTNLTVEEQNAWILLQFNRVIDA
jgi:cytidylate kinase